MMLDKSEVSVTDMEVRLVASNRLGDTATSKTVAVAKTLRLGKSFQGSLTVTRNQSSSLTAQILAR